MMVLVVIAPMLHKVTFLPPGMLAAISCWVFQINKQ